MDVVKEDTAEVEVTEEDTVDRNNWRRKSAVATPDGKNPKERRRSSIFMHIFIVHRFDLDCTKKKTGIIISFKHTYAYLVYCTHNFGPSILLKCFIRQPCDCSPA